MSRERTHKPKTETEPIDSAFGVASDLLPYLTGHGDLHVPVMPSRHDRFSGALEQMGAWFSEQDATGRTLYVSPSIRAVTGVAAEDAMQPDRMKIHPDDMPAMREFAVSVGKTGRGAPCRFRLQHARGHWIWIEVSAIGWCPASEGGFHTVSFNRDITDQVEAAEALHESQERYRIVAEMSSDMIVEVAADGRTTYLSPGGLDVFGYTAEELLAHKPFEIIHPDDHDRLKANLAKVLTTDEPQHFEAFRCRRKDGQWLWLESTGLTIRRANGEIRYLGVTRDITELRQAERERHDLELRMQRAQKLEGLGVMAGGIAHDFNNLLTPILGAASLGLNDLPQDSPVRAQLLKIQRAAQRAAALTNQMLSYAGKSPLLVEPLDLSKLITELGELLESTVSGKTRLGIELATELPLIVADASQITQVVVNLIANAADALPDGAGRIDVRTGEFNVTQPIPTALFADGLRLGRHVYFEVADTGSGMDRDTLARIFDPFFTTKFTGRGLGLAAVAGIVRGHHGAIEIDSELGVGTRIRVLLPASKTTAATVSDASPAPSAWRGHGTVLVVDDDPGVRDLVEEILNRVGLDVLSAVDGRSGVELFRHHLDEIKLVLLDRTMPSSGGRETLGEIRAIDPNANVVLISGYSQERATSGLGSDKLVGFLKKPFLPEQLTELVREVLDA